VLCAVAATESRFGKSRRKPVRRFDVMGDFSSADPPEAQAERS
jgi:hypothetical protein